MIESSFFRVSVENGVAQMVMNRPEKANGMNDAFWNDLPKIIRALDDDPSVRVLVLSGEGKHFTGGMDLSGFDFVFEVMKEEPARAAFAFRKDLLRLQNALTSLEIARFPVIAAIHGACIGAGVDLISTCDIRVATADAIFSIEEVNVGMAADVGTLQRLPKLIAPGIVKELSYTGRRFTAVEARDWGLVNSVHDDREAMLDTAFSMARQIASKSPIAVAGIKQAIDYVRDRSVADGLNQIANWNSGMLRPADLKAAITARMESRDAMFADLLSANKTDQP